MGNAASQQTLAGWDVEDVANLFEDDEEIGWFAPIVVENEIDGEKLPLKYETHGEASANLYTA